MKDRIVEFLKYTELLKGDEKGEAQVFCDRFFKLFGHEGYKEAGAILEFRVKNKKSTRFADLLWSNKVLIEMKKRGSQLKSHRSQIFDYWWKLRPNQPKYSILCNFDEFIIYDFSIQDEPLDHIKLKELSDRYTAFNFMFPKAATPIFHNNLEEVTRESANLVAEVFNSMINRNEDREGAQRFILQCVFTMFAEDYDLLPKDIFTQILLDCKEGKGDIYDLINGLFKQMDSKESAKGGRFKDVAYFNGGLFSHPDVIEMTNDELKKLYEAAAKKWNKVNPAIFGTIFQSSMGAASRHAYGAHFTSELDILKIVHPTIIKPWRDKIAQAKTLTEMKDLRKEISNFKVLDPACGSGNFLYVAFRELKRIEMELLNKIHIEFPKSASEIGTQSIISIKQFFGLDYNSFAVALAKVTLMLAKEITIKETRDWVDTKQIGIDFQMEETLPLDNMDENIICADALFTEWPESDVIIGNPPYQSKNKMQNEFGIEYLNMLRNSFSEISGLADYCVYWFYKAHNHMKVGNMSGLVGTNTIRQNYSRDSSLDYIIRNSGCIFNAVSSQPWSGDAVVFVSIVNWVKGNYSNQKKLYVEDENLEQVEYNVDEINSSLTLKIDVSRASILDCNKFPKLVFQGQTHGHKGFLLSIDKGKELIERDVKYAKILKPFLIGDILVGKKFSQPDRYVIDFGTMNILDASLYKEAYEIVKQTVLPARKIKANEQELMNKKALENNPNAKVNKHHINFYNKWWQLSYGRKDMIEMISGLKRYITCSRVSARPIFEFVSANINPNDALMVFAFEDDYTFGIIHSMSHIIWYQEKCSSLKGDPRYTTDSIWDTFPFPQFPKLIDVKKIAQAARELREKRNEIMSKHNYSLRDIYRILEQPGANPLKKYHEKLDDLVLSAYNFNKRKDLLAQLLELNLNVASRIEKGEEVQCPGLPKCVKNKSEFISEDCIKIKSE